MSMMNQFLCIIEPPVDELPIVCYASSPCRLNIGGWNQKKDYYLV